MAAVWHRRSWNAGVVETYARLVSSADCEIAARAAGYGGCGAHVEQVLGNVPPAQRCRCREAKANGNGAGATAAPRSWLRNLFGQ